MPPIPMSQLKRLLYRSCIFQSRVLAFQLKRIYFNTTTVASTTTITKADYHDNTNTQKQQMISKGARHGRSLSNSYVGEVMPSPVCTAMGDCPVFNSCCGKSIYYITSHPGQLNLAIPPWVGAMSTSDALLLGNKGRYGSCVGGR